MLPYYLLVFQFLEYRIFFIYPKFDIQRFFFFNEYLSRRAFINFNT